MEYTEDNIKTLDSEVISRIFDILYKYGCDMNENNIDLVNRILNIKCPKEVEYEVSVLIDEIMDNIVEEFVSGDLFGKRGVH